MYDRATEMTDLAFCTSYEDETSADGQQHLAYTSELEAIALKGCQTTCLKYPHWQNVPNVAKKKPFLDLQCLQRNRPSAVLLQSWLCSRGRTRLELVLFLQLLCSWRYKSEYVSMSSICDVSCTVNHMVRFTRPSGSIFAYCKRSKSGAGEGLWERG